MKNTLKEFIFPVIFLLAIISISLIVTGKREYEKSYLSDFYKVRVQKITKEETINNSDEDVNVTTVTYFKGKILQGRKKGEVLNCYKQEDDNGLYSYTSDIKVGKTAYVAKSSTSGYHIWTGDYRVGGLLFLVALLFIPLIIFGKIKGAKTIFTIVITITAIFGTFIPAIFFSNNIYLWLWFTVLYIIFSTLLTVNGTSIKSRCAMLSCTVGALLVFILSIFFARFFNINGGINSDTMFLTQSFPNINLVKVLISGTVLSCIGAIMDVAVELSASLYELFLKAKDNSPKSLIKSGFSIGRDMIGTMSNTLMMACIGCELIPLLIIIRARYPLGVLLSTEMFVIEILQIVIGSIGILSAIPITTYICAFLYNRKR